MKFKKQSEYEQRRLKLAGHEIIILIVALIFAIMTLIYAIVTNINVSPVDAESHNQIVFRKKESSSAESSHTYSGHRVTSSSVTLIVNINTATVDELMMLNGIGEKKAQTIIEYRKQHGRFSKIEDIMNVDGIGMKTFENIKRFITVG